MEDLVPFVLAGLALTCSPGPANFSLAAMGAAFGAGRSLAYQAGSVLGMVVIMAVTASGLAALLLALPGVREAAVIAGLAYILWLAWKAVSVSATDGAAEVAVADTGLGIAADELEHLFSRFFRASTATRNAVPGVGLGLTITKAIVTAHGGEMDVTSQEGVGTRFSMRIPLPPVLTA